MSNHEIEVRFFPNQTEYPDTYVAVCSCRRWRSKHHPDKGDAENAGMTHVVQGDQHNRAAAAFDHGRPTLASQAKWFRTMADDPTTGPREREQWLILAEEAERRASPPDTSEQMNLF